MALGVAWAKEPRPLVRVGRLESGVAVKGEQFTEWLIGLHHAPVFIEEGHGVLLEREGGFDVAVVDSQSLHLARSPFGLHDLGQPPLLDVPGHGRLLNLYSAAEDAEYGGI